MNGGPGLPCDYVRDCHSWISDKGYKVVAYDQLGCGQSDKPDNKELWDVKRYATELNTIIKTLNLKNIQNWKKKHNLLRSILFLSLLFITLSIQSQKVFTTVSGLVLDSISKSPLENATVIVRDVFSNEIISGISSNQEGSFKIYTDTQDFILEIKLIGYENKIFNELDITKMSTDQLCAFRNKNIGIVFQSFYLIPNYTAIENVSLALEINKIKDPINKAKEILDKFGLGKRLNNLPSQLSGGEQQRVAIARSIVMKPELILADEPTGNLDSENSELISNILFDYVKEENASLIMVTHDNKLANLSKRIIKIKDGKIE